MIIAGAGGHAREVFDILNSDLQDQVCFFDNVNDFFENKLLGKPILKSEVEVLSNFELDRQFIVGTGNSNVREKLYDFFVKLGGAPVSIIASSAIISSNNVRIGKGCNIMHDCFISNFVQIGDGTLVNTRANIHHDVEIGSFCEIGPSATLLGRVKVGCRVLIGAGAILLPGVNIGDNAIVGAGAIVVNNVDIGSVVKGNPAK